MKPTDSKIYKKFSPIIYAQCLKLLKHHGAATEAVDEIFKRGYTKVCELNDDEQREQYISRLTAEFCFVHGPRLSPALRRHYKEIPLPAPTVRQR